MAENNGYTNGAMGNYRPVDSNVGDPWADVDMNSPQQVIEARAKQENVDYKLFNDSGDSAIYDLARQLNLRIDPQTKDYLTQYYLQEKGSENAMARSREFNREQYSDMVEGLRKAGLNPMLALQGLNGANMMQGQSTQSGLYTQARNSQNQTNANLAGSIIGTILMAIAIVIAHAI